LVNVPLQHVLAEEAEFLCVELHNCLARVGSVLARAEFALGMLKVASIVPLLSGLEVGSVVEGEACLYGDFSPRPSLLPSLLLAVSSTSQSEDISEVVAPVLKIMPELYKLSVELSMLITKELGSLEDLAVPMTPTPPLSLDLSKSFTLMDCGGLDATATHFSCGYWPLGIFE
jgi:hypothetical protein